MPTTTAAVNVFDITAGKFVDIADVDEIIVSGVAADIEVCIVRIAFVVAVAVSPLVVVVVVATALVAHEMISALLSCDLRDTPKRGDCVPIEDSNGDDSGCGCGCGCGAGVGVGVGTGGAGSTNLLEKVSDTRRKWSKKAYKRDSTSQKLDPPV